VAADHVIIIISMIIIIIIRLQLLLSSSHTVKHLEERGRQNVLPSTYLKLRRSQKHFSNFLSYAVYGVDRQTKNDFSTFVEIVNNGYDVFRSVRKCCNYIIF
jgi:hypothetical protein